MKKSFFLLAALLSISNLFAQLSFSYTLLPNERITPYLFLWSIAGSPQGSEPAYVQWASPQPAAPWLLETSPDSFTMQSCMDIRLIRMEILAPAQTGYKSTNLLDLAAPPASDLSLSINVVSNPTADTTINVTAAPGQEVTLYFPIKSELPYIIFGCSNMSYSPPDSLQKHRFWSPANGTWINFANDTIEVGPHDTAFKTVKLKSDVTGTFQTFFNRYREFRSFPVRTKVVFKVQTVSATQEATDVAQSTAPPFPNPASDIVSFPIKTAVYDEVSIALYDWSGKLVDGVDFQAIEPGGEQMLHCPVGQLPAGNYSYKMRFQRSGMLQCGRLSVMH